MKSFDTLPALLYNLPDPKSEIRNPMSVTDEIKERLDIVEVISQYVPLKKAGRNYKGLCPFHSEKTPSFVVFPDSQSWHCFGACSTGGDLFTFIMKRENLSFGEALELLAARAGVELMPRAGSLSVEEQRLERLREIVANAAGYYHYLLVNAPEAGIARDTLARRGLLPATWESWQLGYALDSWDALTERLVAKGYTLEELEAAGLVVRRDDGSGCYDRFRGRLMIPIRDVRGRTIGFGGRILREDPAHPQPKYINSPQTPLFDKSAVLFGLDMAHKAIRDSGLAVIVEGYMDVLMAHQAGFTNVVAGMGTALTEEQLRQLKRYTANVTLALDPDVAGDHAVVRGLETARQALEREWQPVIDPRGLVRQESRLKTQVRIAALPDGLDPDELIQRDPDRWRQVIAGAKPIVDYYLGVVGREEDLSSARGKANAVARMAPLIREIANAVERNHYIQLLARLIQTDERLVAGQVEAAGRTTATQPIPERRVGAPDTGLPSVSAQDLAAGQAEPRPVLARATSRLQYGLEEHLLGHLLAWPELLARLDAEMSDQNAPPLSEDDFTSEENRTILAALQASLSSGEDWAPERVLEALPEVLHPLCQALAERARQGPPLTEEKLAKDAGDSLLRLRARNLSQRVGQLQFLIRDGEETGAREQLREYHELMVLYTAQKRQIQRLLDARTMIGALRQ